MTPEAFRHAIAISKHRRLQGMFLTGGQAFQAHAIHFAVLYRWGRPSYLHVILTAPGQPTQEAILHPEAIQALVFEAELNQEQNDNGPL